MPRATRSSLGGGEAAASRSRSKTPASRSPKATTAVAVSPSMAKGKAKVEKTPESKRQGRSTSRGKASAAAEASPSPAAGKASRSRSSSTAVSGKKTPPAPSKRGHEKASQEEEEVKPKRAKSQDQSAGKSPQRKGRSPAKAATPIKSKSKSPGKAAASTSGNAKSPAARKSKSPVVRKTKSPAAPAKDKGKSPAKSAKRQSKSPAKAAASKSPRTPTVKTTSKKTEAKKSTPRSQAKATPPSRVSKSPRTPAKSEKKKADTKSSPHGRGATATASTPKSSSRRSQEPEKAEGDVEQVTEEKETTEPDEEQEKNVEEATEGGEIDAKMEGDRDDTKDSSVEENLADNIQEKEPSECKDADVAEEVKKSEVSSLKAEDTAAPVQAPVENASQEKSQSSAAEATEEPMEDDKNGVEDNSIPSPPSSTAVKRKFEEVSEESEDGPSSKQARVNGTEREEDMDMNSSKPSGDDDELSEEGLLEDYVIINKEEIPAADSSEVAASIPATHEGATPQPMETEKEAEPSCSAGLSGSNPVFLVPLTQVEVIKACAYASGNQPDPEDASSVAVEVGSLASSEMSSRQLDVLDTLSAGNSVDGDRAASECNLDDSVDDVDKTTTEESTLIPVTTDSSLTAEVQSGATSNPADPVIVPATDSSSSSGPATTPPMSACAEPQTDDCLENNSDPATGCPQSPLQLPEGIPIDTNPVVQNTGLSAAPKDTASQGDTDSASLSSSGVFTRTYVPNPAVPAESVAPENCFSLVSYNILAECNRQKADYSYTEEEYLVQDYRHSVLMKELQYLDGDLVCLQEVNPHYFHSCLQPAMKSLGYDGLIMRRTKDAFDEGEATFFKTSVFELEASKGVSLSEVAFSEVEKGGVSEEVGASLRKYLDHADVVLVTRLRHKATGKVVTVGNIHVIWDFSRSPDVQCVQIACAIEEVVCMSGSGGAHILCGDFNSECTSPAYQMVREGSLSDFSFTTLQAVNNLDLQNGPKSLVSHLRQAFQHTSTPLQSAYFTVTKSEPEITSMTSFMEGAVDYQFYSTDTLVPVGVLKTVEKAVIEATGGLPTKEFPSDHISLKSIMTFC